MRFPLTDPEPETLETMHKIWARHRLEPYLKRWARTDQPTPPEAFWRFPWLGCDLGRGLGKFLIEQSNLHPERA